MYPETYIRNNTVKTHHGRHTHSKKQIPKSNNTFAALRTIPLQNNSQYCRKKVQGHCQNNPNFPSRNKTAPPPPPTILNPKKTASWETADRQMTKRVCCGPRKAEAREGRKPGKTQTTCATGKGKQRRGNRGRRHTAVTQQWFDCSKPLT
jgi:hypothetical protein